MVSKLLKLFCHIILLILVSCAKETKDNRKINDLPIYLKSKETPSNENLNFTRGKIIDLWTDKNILPQDFFEAFLVNDKAQAKHLCKLEKFSDSLNIALINSNLYYIHENILYAYDINHCKLLFSRKLEDKEYKIKSVIGFSFDNANIYVTTGARTLYNIDQKNGEIKWVVKLPNFLRSKPIYNNDYVYVIAVDDSIYKINANDGSLIWVDNYSIMHDKIVKDASITIEDNIIFHISSLGELIAKDLTTSDEILRRSIVKKENSNYFDTSLYSYIYSDYRYEYPFLYIIFDGNISAFTKKGLVNIWDYELSSINKFLPIDEYLFTISNNNLISIINNKNGKLLKKYEFEGKITSGLFINSNLLLTDSRGYLTKLNVNNGKILSQIKISEYEITNFFSKDSHLYFIDILGNLFIM